LRGSADKLKETADAITAAGGRRKCIRAM
jgi:hypothetical protein